MVISKSQVAPIETWSADQFGDWLRRGMLDSITGDNPLRRFEPLHDVIIPTRPIHDQLEEIYEQLSAVAKDAFGTGLGIAARELPNTPIGIECFNHLALLLRSAEFQMAKLRPDIVERAGDNDGEKEK